MRTLTGPVSTQAAAAQSGWCEIVDLYLKATINTPVGATSVLRLCTFPGGLSFFTPKLAPEPVFGAAQQYSFWPLRRELVRSDANFITDKLTLTASNVTAEWAQMLADVDWYDVPVIIRKVPTTVTAPTADDCAVIFSGFIDACRVTNEQVQMTCSNDFSSFNVKKPAETMHHNCRFKWGDDWCTALRYASANHKTKTVGGGSTNRIVFSSGLTEDNGIRASLGFDCVNALADAAFFSTSAFAGFPIHNIRSGTAGSWRFDEVWGTVSQGAYQIPVAQAGLKNPALQPYLQIDFGTARQVRLWRIKNNADILERVPRLLLFFSSPDKTVWTFESYHECNAVLGGMNVVNIPQAAAARYWRICIRSRWLESNFVADIENVEAYEGGRNWWANGIITFAGNTTTPTLRNVTRRVLESYSGEISVMQLPTAPVLGDTFVIERGCPRSFNGCAERLNTENYGGFDSLPNETVPR